ncbi:Pentatricopeptide repeat-containing protein [Camellia lanceoleosa]|uniref:Pentatricopeptide repeat-containing protein n=1 Tax=Camellia lanceoleosa TaxID=1840588 RepID=A0ACC0H419_9ERIC|nr:Pentatricopeptide repeat-containing protein [Camellia lanceoleosa]
MQSENVEPSEFTMVSLLNASARLGAIKQGKWIHDYMRKKDMDLNNVIVVTAIIDMYCKCGCIEKGLEVFEKAPVKGLSCWNSIILGLATNGREEEALQFFLRLESLSEHEPDCVSFIGVLTACNHSGLVDKARDYFTLMTKKYNIEPSMRHYGCLVDVLGRAGLVEEAEEVIMTGMPMSPDEVILGSLLSACWKHGNVEIGQRVAKKLVELNPRESCGYVLMSNFYAASGEFEKAMAERIAMKKKQPGCSSIEIDGVVHEFVAGGRRLNPQIQEIYYLSND